MSKLTPFIRYALLILAGMASRGGWLPDHLSEEIANDPIVVEMVTGAVIALSTFVWYLWSKSRKALNEAFK